MRHFSFPFVTFFLPVLSLAALAQEEPNLLRNPGFEDGPAGWRLPREFAVAGDVARTGAHSLRLDHPDAASYPLASQKIELKPGRQYRYSAWIKTRGVTGSDSGATICMEWSGAKGWLGGSYESGKKGDQDWFRVEGITAPVPEEATGIHVSLYLRKGMTGTAWFDDVSVSEFYPPALDASLLRPNYRGRLCADAADPRVIVRARVAEHLKGSLTAGQTTLLGSLRKKGAETVQERRIHPPQAGVNDVMFDGGALSPGEYQVRLELTGPDGVSLGRQEFDLHKLAPDAPRPAVFIDEHNRTMVDGKPFFPLGWYFGPGPSTPDYAGHLDRVAASAFNTIMCYGVNSGGIDKVRAYLDAFSARNLKLIYSIKDVYEGTRWFHEPVLGFRGEEAIVRGVVSAFKDHPALLAWYLNDELPLSMRDRLDARQRLVSALDPNHPTWAVLYQVDEFAGYQNSADVLGTDPYPIPSKPVTLAADWTRKCAAVSDGMRPLWMVPQAFDWGNYRKETAAESRPPTLDEELVMTYLCLIHGAHGLIYYSYSDLMRDPRGFEKRWADMVVVGDEVKQLFPALLSTAAADGPEVEIAAGAIDFARRADDERRRYVLMANPSPDQPATVRVTVSSGAELQLLRRGERKPLPAPQDGRCHVALPPMGAATLIIEP